MNSIYLIGRSGADAELRYTQNGTAVLNLSIAVNEKKGDGYEANWFKVSAYSKTAEAMAQKIKKGCEIFVQGKLSSRNWEDKNGQKRNTVEVIAQWLRVVDRSEPQPSSPYANQDQQQPQMTSHTFMNESDVPF